MRVMNSKSFYESFQENLKKEDILLEQSKPKLRKLKENVEEMQPKYSGRNSFYGKAFITTDGNKKTLTSYRTKIMSVEDGKITMLCDEDALTQTTLRHIREFLQQLGLQPLTRKQLVDKIKGLKESDENDEFEQYSDFSDGDIVLDIINNFKKITGKEVKDVLNYSKDEENGGFFKQKEVDETGKLITDYLKEKGLDQSRIDEIYYKLDDELSGRWKDYIPDNLKEDDKPLKDYYLTLQHDDGKFKVHTTATSKEQAIKQVCDMEKAPESAVIDIKEGKVVCEQDQTVRVVTANNDREYTIVDITELQTVSDGDVQAPIDITGLLEKVNERLEESVGVDWGVINYQSTRFNKETNNSNALFELCTGGKTYLMSMLLEENGSLFKVNNTKGQTIFKRKTNGDMVQIVESYIKQFLPKNEEPEVIKHINKDLHDRYDFIKLQMDLLKDVPKEEKDAFTLYLQNQVYAFVAEVSNEITQNEPTEEDKLELPSFDKMVEDIFGKQWVKEQQQKENKLELDGVEELKESVEPEEDKELDFEDRVLRAYDNCHYSLRADMPTITDIIKYLGLSDDSDIREQVSQIIYHAGKDWQLESAKPYIRRKDGSEELTKSELRAKWKEAREEGGWSVEEYPFEKYLADVDETQEWELVESDDNQLYIYSNAQSYDKSDADSWADVYRKEAPKLKFKVRKDGEMWFVDFIGKKEDIESYLKELKWYDIKEIADLIKPYNNLHESDEVDTTPKNGLGTGYATFARKAANLNEVDEKSKTFTDGKASYLVCSQKKLSKDEFDDLQENLLRENDYCKGFEPVDTENYSYNVIEFTCPDYDYRLLVDPAGYNYCRYVAKVNRGE